MVARIEDWLEQMRQAQEPGPMVRVVVVRNARGAGWTFDLTENTELGELADRIEGTIRDANCTRCEMRALDSEGRVIGNLPYDRRDATGVAQLVATPAAMPIPVPVEDSIEAVLKTHRSMTALNIRGIAESYDFAKQIIHQQRKEINDLVEALGLERRAHAAELVAVRKDYNAEVVALRQEGAELRKRVAEQWALEDPARSKMLDKQMEVQKEMSHFRMAETLFGVVMGKLTGGGSSPAGQVALLNNVMRLFHSFTPEQHKKLFELLTHDQQVLFIEIVEQAQKIEQAQANPEAGSDPNVGGSEAVNMAAAIANGPNAKKN